MARVDEIDTKRAAAQADLAAYDALVVRTDLPSAAKLAIDFPLAARAESKADKPS